MSTGCCISAWEVTTLLRTKLTVISLFQSDQCYTNDDDDDDDDDEDDEDDGDGNVRQLRAH